MAGAMCVINARDGTCTRFYTHKARFDNLSENVLLLISEKILDALKYLVLYEFVLRMNPDLVLTALAMH